MDLSFGTQLLQAIVFGLVFAGLHILIGGATSPWPWRTWLANATVLAGLAYIILFGLIST